ILADKSDVHFSRVQNPIMDTFDIHDRVNYAVQKSRVEVLPHEGTIELTLEIDTSYASVMEYFEIFLERMVACRRAAETLGLKFALRVNGVKLE
ncbi:MAG: phosphohydrolase, partial [Armatimonadetes bacterium]|nr:phosphohydrolase [Armatimonadota bacterium]